MFRKDAVANKTLGETLLYFICSVATNTNVKHSAPDSVTRTAMSMVHSHLFTGKTNDYDTAQTLDSAFTELAKTNTTLTFESQEFLLACAMLCHDYAETVYHLCNEEAEHLPF